MTIDTTPLRKTSFGTPHSKQSKIQSLIIKHLLDHGTLDLILPDGIVLEIGITTTDKNGDQIKSDEYCFVVAKRQDKTTMLDSYNLGLSFVDDNDTIVFEDRGHDEYGLPIRRVDVI